MLSQVAPAFVPANVRKNPGGVLLTFRLEVDLLLCTEQTHPLRLELRRPLSHLHCTREWPAASLSTLQLLSWANPPEWVTSAQVSVPTSGPF